ncbi:MAG: hypothetical protein HYX67_08160, partial [Candidatus Melainabacteria bacterium]|nr:hypothetical protein [Candidatus Melainabacteria bacterium]
KRNRLDPLIPTAKGGQEILDLGAQLLNYCNSIKITKIKDNAETLEKIEYIQKAVGTIEDLAGRLKGLSPSEAQRVPSLSTTPTSRSPLPEAEEIVEDDLANVLKDWENVAESIQS